MSSFGLGTFKGEPDLDDPIARGLPDDDSCPDCGASVGELHRLGSCDVEQCYACGGQMLQCHYTSPCPHCQEHHSALNCVEELVHEEERIPWDGEWPGNRLCREYDLWSHDCPGYKGKSEDLNIIPYLFSWDRDARSYIPNTERIVVWKERFQHLPWQQRFEAFRKYLKEHQ